jgi:hypothetical protein
LGVLKDGFHDRLLIFVLRPFFQILALLATLIENAARSQILFSKQPGQNEGENTDL